MTSKELNWTSWQTVLATFVLTLVALIIWIKMTQNYIGKVEELCKRGEFTVGKIIQVGKNNSNEGNIESLEISYSYSDDQLKVHSGMISVKNQNVKLDDPIKIIYSKNDPEFHVAGLDKIENDCASFPLAMFDFHNFFIVFVFGILVLILVTQIYCWYLNACH